MKIAYWDGYALGLLKDEWAVNRFDDIMRRGSKSKEAVKATLAMAELYFDLKGPGSAIPYYKKVLKSKNKMISSYAKYKLAWSEYVLGVQSKNRGKQKKAISIIARLAQSLGKQSGALGALGKKAKDDTLGLVVDFGDIAEAKRILKSVKAMDVYANLLEKMAYTKLEAGDRNGAYNLFAMVIKESPKSPNNPQTSVNLMGLAAQMNNVPLVAKLVKISLAKFVNPKSKWRKAQKKSHLKKTDVLLEATSFEYATVLDREGRNTNKPAYLVSASELYRYFIKYFPKSKKVYDAKYFNIQISDTQGKFSEAAKGYYALIEEEPKNKNTRGALDLMLNAAQSTFDGDKQKFKFPPPGTMKKPMKLPATKQLYADCIELYAKNSLETKTLG